MMAQEHSAPTHAVDEEHITLHTDSDVSDDTACPTSAACKLESPSVVAVVVAPPPARLTDAILAAMKRTLIPGIILQIVALGLIILYYGSSGARSSFDALADLKTRGGYLFSGVSTAIAGGIIPTLVNWAKEERDKKKKQQQHVLHQVQPICDAAAAIVAEHPIKPDLELDLESASYPVSHSGVSVDRTTGALTVDSHPSLTKQSSTSSTPILSRTEYLLFTILFWFQHGVEVDAFFRLQSVMFGDDNAFATILWKTLVDQLVYGPMWSVPFSLTVFTFRDSRFSVGVVAATLKSRQFWTWAVPQAVIGSWLVWVPAVAIIYCLPGTLQIPLFVLVTCFWSLLLSLLAAK